MPIGGIESVAVSDRTALGNQKRLRVELEEPQQDQLHVQAPESSRRGVGARALDTDVLDTNGKPIPNSGHWSRGPSVPDQFWPRGV